MARPVLTIGVSVPMLLLAGAIPAVAGGPTPSPDAAANPCVETAYGMPCDPGDGNACGGVCQPDFSQAGAPMNCVVFDAAARARLKVPTLDGIDCSPNGLPGSDCAHACSGGLCVMKNAGQGAACMPTAGTEAGTPGLPLSVCSGTCDGNGICNALAHGCDKYGRGELGACLYTACSPVSNVPGCEQFASPPGTSCSVGNVCMTGETCSSNGSCTGGTPVPGCTNPDYDAAGLAMSHVPADDSGAAAQPDQGPVGAPGGGTRAAAQPNASTSSGCSAAGFSPVQSSRTATPLALSILGLVAMQRSRTRRSRAVKRSRDAARHGL